MIPRTSNEEIIVLGIGDYTVVVAELAERCGFTIKGLLHYNDDLTGQTHHDYPVLGSFAALAAQDISGINFALSMGNNKIRHEHGTFIRECGGRTPRLIHPTADISKRSTIAEGTIIKQNVSLQPCTRIGFDTIICDNSIVCHHTTVGDACFLATASLIGARITVGSGVFFGQGAVAPSNKAHRIGAYATIGAGALVLTDIADHAVIVGRDGHTLPSTAR